MLMLPQIQVASPCRADWDGMTGNNRVRHCAQCNLNVYNLSVMTSDEVAQLVLASKGQRLCGRLYRRADGTILTSDCPIGLRARIRRVSRIVGAALSAAMSLSLAAAQTPQHEPASLVQIQEAGSEIYLFVFDPSGAVIPKAQVVVVNQAGKHVAEGTTNSSGRLRLSKLSPETYDVMVQSPGFATLRREGVVVLPHQTVDMEVTLQAGSATVTMMGEISIVSLQTQPSPIDLHLIPERVIPNAPSPEAPAVPQPAAASRSPLRKLLHSLGHVLNP
jgi:hypothetical protein